MKRAKQKAFSLVELLIVLSVILSMVALGFFIFKKLETNNMTNKEYNNIQTALNLTDNYYTLSNANPNLILEESGYIKNKNNEMINSAKFPVILFFQERQGGGMSGGNINEIIYIQTKLPADVSNQIELRFKNDIKNKSRAITSLCATPGSLGNTSSEIRENLYNLGAEKLKDQLTNFENMGLSKEQVDEIYVSMLDTLRNMVNNMSDEELALENQLGGTRMAANTCDITIFKY